MPSRPYAHFQDRAESLSSLITFVIKRKSGNTAQILALFTDDHDSREYSVANNKDPNQKRPGEKEPGKYHYNPGNMSEKTIDSGKPEFGATGEH